MVRNTWITYRCYVWFGGGVAEGGEVREEWGTITMIIFTVQHHFVSCGISQATDTSYTPFHFFLFYHKITSAITGPIQHDTPHISGCCRKQGWGWGEAGRWLRLRQTGNVPLRRGAFWFAGGSVGLVLKQQDSAKTNEEGDLKSRV